MSVLNKTLPYLGYVALIFTGMWSFSTSAGEIDTIESVVKENIDESQSYNYEFSTLLEIEWAYGTTRGSSQKLEFIFDPEVNIELHNNDKVTVIGRLRVDAEDKLEPSGTSDLDLRELYYETELGQTYFTVGKQQIVWGKADGLKVLDLVNPQDFREFILDDFDDSRIPLWTINAEIQVSDSVLQLIWVPDQTYHNLAETNSLYAFTSPTLVPVVPSGVSVDLRPVEKPARVIKDSDYGIRLSSFIGGWDVSLNYLYHYYDTPVLYRSLTLSPQPMVTVTPRYERSHLLGSAFSNAFGDFVLRGEIGYSTDRYFLPDDVNDNVIKSDELAYVFGLDWSGLEDTFFSVQLFQSRLIDDQSGLIRDKVDTTMTLLARRNFMNDTLVAELMLLHNMNNDDGLVRPKITYDWNDNIKAWVGADIFYGDEKGLFGQFDSNDRLTMGVQWGL